MVFYFPAFNALIADSLPPRRRGIGYSLWWVFPSVFGILSPYVGGYLITILGVEPAMRVLYGLIIVTTGTIATMNLKFLKETKRGNGKTKGRSGFGRMLVESYRDVVDVFRWLPRQLKVFTLMLILSFFMNNLAAPYWVVHGVGEIGLSELQWGTVLLISSVVYVALLIPAGIAVDRFGGKKVISLALAATVCPTFLFPFSRSLTDTILLFILVTIANAFLVSGAPAYMADAVPTEKRGRVMAVLGQGMLFVNTRGLVGGPGMGAILAVPSILGAMLGGVVYSYSLMLPWMLLSVTTIFSVVIFLVFAPEEKNNGKTK
jgi:MFS family permease